MIDKLGDRMKEHYENTTRFYLPRRSYTIIRIDGKSFHNYTKKLQRPFDMDFIEDMDTTAKYLCKNIQGAKFAYVQSDEISILITDFDNIGTDAWFSNNIQKMASVSASMATVAFNKARIMRFKTPMYSNDIENYKWAEVDSRVFQIPARIEVENYFIFRQQDCTRNSITSVAQRLFSSKELHSKSGEEKQEMIFTKGINWNDYDPKLKRGRGIVKNSSEMMSDDSETYVRSSWVTEEVPIFSKDREYLRKIIPVME